MPYQINTSRLLLRGVHRAKGRQYAIISELRCSDREATAIIADWNSRGHIQMFLIYRAVSQGPQSLSVRPGMVSGLIQLPQSDGVNQISSIITHPDIRGRGLMKEASAVVFEYAFDRIHQRKLFLEMRSDTAPLLMWSLRQHRYVRQRSEWCAAGTQSLTYLFGRQTWH